LAKPDSLISSYILGDQTDLCAIWIRLGNTVFNITA